MTKLLNLLSERLIALMLALAFAVTALFPFVAWADRPGERNIGALGNKPGARTGDPLDTNDAGGDDSDDNVQGNSVISSPGDTWKHILRSRRIVLVPQYTGTTVVFKIILLPDPDRSAEDSDAK